MRDGGMLLQRRGPIPLQTDSVRRDVACRFGASREAKCPGLSDSPR